MEGLNDSLLEAWAGRGCCSMGWAPCPRPWFPVESSPDRPFSKARGEACTRRVREGPAWCHAWEGRRSARLFCDVPLLPGSLLHSRWEASVELLPAGHRMSRMCWKGPVVLAQETARFKSQLLGKFMQMHVSLVLTCPVSPLPKLGRWQVTVSQAAFSSVDLGEGAATCPPIPLSPSPTPPCTQTQRPLESGGGGRPALRGTAGSLGRGTVG